MGSPLKQKVLHAVVWLFLLLVPCKERKLREKWSDLSKVKKYTGRARIKFQLGLVIIR